MSITVRLWDDKELKDIKSGKNKWLATIFMNGGSYSSNEIKYYPYNLRKTFVAFLEGSSEPIKIYATDKKMAIKFIKAEYNTKDYPIVEIKQKNITYT